ADESHVVLPPLFRAYQRVVFLPAGAATRGERSVSARRPAPAVENPVESPRDALAHTVEQSAAAPVAAVELLRLGTVGREDRSGLRGELGALDLLVGLEIPAEAPAVEIARSQAQPVIAHRHLAVQYPRLVLEDPHTVAQ